MRGYRNHPGGMGGMSENITRTSAPVALEDVVTSGNRAQRRWAQKRLTKIERSKSIASADASTPQANHSADGGASLSP